MNEVDPPVPGSPIVYSPATFDRHDAAVRYVEGLIQTRAPFPGSGRFADSKPGAWGLLHPGDTITAGSGLTLGSGTVTLCTQDGSTLTDTGQAVTVYNNGSEIDGGAYGYGYDDGVALPLEWTEAGWSVCQCTPDTGCHLCVVATNCLLAAVSGATVTLEQGYATIGTCTTNASGKCCFDITDTGGGEYRITVEKTGYIGSSKTVTMTCPGTHIFPMLLDTTPQVTFTITGCNSHKLPGATVTIDGEDHTTDSLGVVNVVLATGTYPWSVSNDRFVTQTGTLIVSACTGQFIDLTLVPDTGYECSHCDFNTAWPMVKSALTLTDSVYGSFSLAYDAPNHGYTSGNVGVTFPGGCLACPPHGTMLRYSLGNNDCSSGCNLAISGVGAFCPTSPGLPDCAIQYGGSLPLVSLTQTSNPFSMTFVYHGCLDPGWTSQKIWPTLTTTITITE